VRKRDLERVFIEWQVALHLADWEIDFHPERDPDMKDTLGTCGYDIHERTATIHVDPKAKDPEAVAVHELLHLWLSPLCGRSTAKVYEEQAVEAITKTLIKLKRRAA
jgi:hypothetical protein